MKLKELENKLYEELNMALFSASDKSLNGVQVGNLDKEIKKIALVVDASLESFKQAKANNADLIICHHGLFWGKPLAIKGSHYNRIKFLIDNDIALFAAHLPLDAHMVLGNNIGLANILKLIKIEAFGRYHGSYIGVKGEFVEEKSIDEIKKLLIGDNEPVYIVPGGSNSVKTVAIVSGGGTQSIHEAINDNIDLFITGDINHEVYHTCIEEGINMISAGHYATETNGVKSLGKFIQKEFGIESVFIDIPTGA